MRSFVLALIICPAAAVIAEEVRDVSPEEFHKLALLQGGKPKKNVLANNQADKPAKSKKFLTEEEKKEKRDLWLSGKDKRNADNNLKRHVQEEEDIVKEEAAALAAVTAAPTEEGSDMPFLKKKEEERAMAETNVAKANKTYACTEKGSQILSFYISGLNIAPTKPNQAKEKCMRTQLNQHCMPYEKVDLIYIEPCDATDYTCLNRRVLQDHPDCLNHNVDWEAIKNYGVSADKGMMEVLAGWCSHIKVLKEVQRRVALDEQFMKEYPAVLMLEDHVLLDKDWTEEVTKDWVNNYKKPWDMVTLDTHGGKAHTDKVDDFRGKAVYKPSWKAQYGGFHAVLVKTASISTLLEKMQSLNVVPIEWISKSMNDDPKGLEILSWEAGVSSVPWEASENTKDYFLPKECRHLPKEEIQRKR